MQITVPPGSEKQKQTGVIQINIKPIYQNTFIPDSIYAIKLWGYPQSIQFRNQQCKLPIHTTLQKLSQYFYDMNVLQIQSLSSQRKFLGMIFINLRRYFVGNVINSFREVVSVIDKSKKKIGQVSLDFEIKFEPKNEDIFNEQPQRPEDVHNNISQIKKQQESIQDSSHSIDKIFPKSPKHSHEKNQNQQSGRDINKKKPSPINEIKIKHYSEIMRKYPDSNPLMEFMQLRMDELQFFGPVNNNQQIKAHSQYEVLLTNLRVLVGKLKDKTLVITYKFQERQVSTRISMKQQSSGFYTLNHAILFKNVDKSHQLVIESTDGKANCSVFEFLNKNSISIKRKDNNKRFAQLNYSLIKSKPIDQLPSKQQQIRQQTRPEFTYKLIYLPENIEPLSYKIKGQDFGVVEGKMVIYKAMQANHEIRIQIHNQYQLIGHCIVYNNQAYKEEKINVTPASRLHENVKKTLKVITAIGAPPQLHQFIKKYSNKQQKSAPESPIKSIKNKSRKQHLEKIIQLFTFLQDCQNPNCRNLIDQMLKKKDNISQQFAELLQVIPVTNAPQYIQSFADLLHSDFILFWDCFIEFTQWNHRYRKALNHNIKQISKSINLQKLYKHLKKSKSMLFGLLPIQILEKQLIKLGIDERITVNTILLLQNQQRYEDQIKISQLQQIISRSQQSSLTGYLLGLIYSCQMDETSLAVLIRSIYNFQETRQGIILVNALQFQYQTHQSQQSIPNINTQQRQNTQFSHHGTIPKFHTEQPHITQQRQHQQQQQQKEKLSIKIWLNKIIIPENPLFILIDKQSKIDYTSLPLYIKLQDNTQHEIRVVCDDDKIYEGVFIAEQSIKKINIFSNAGEELGYIMCGKNVDNLDQSQIQVSIRQRRQILQSQQQIPQKKPMNIEQQQIQHDPLITNRAQSQLIKIKLCSMQPNYQYPIYFDEYVLDPTKQNQIIIPNKEKFQILPKGSRIKEVPQTGHNVIGISTYAYNAIDSGKVQLLITLQISEYFGSDDLQYGKKVLICNIYHFESLKLLDNGQYQMQIQGDDNYKKTNFIKQKNGRTVDINFSLELRSSENYYNILIIYNREAIANFAFRINFHSKIGCYLHHGYLVDNKGYRLALSVHEINYNDIFSKQEKGQQKFQKLLSIFALPQIQRLSLESSSKRIQQVLRDYGYTITQIYSLLGLTQNPEQFQSLFIYEPNLIQQRRSLKNLFQIYEQYQLFDMQQSGLLQIGKAQVVNRLIFDLQPIPLENFKLSKIIANSLVDKFEHQQNKIDYLKILWNLKRYCQIDGFFNDTLDIDKGKENNFSNNIKKPYKYKKMMRIRLIKYENLKVGNLPRTLLFKIGDKSFADPIPRAYSNQYIAPYPQLIVQYPCKLTILNKQYGVKQLLTFSQLQNVDLVEETKVLGGRIFFQIDEHYQQRYRQQANNSKDTFKKSRINGLKNTLSKWQDTRKQQVSRQTKKIEEILKKDIDFSKFDMIN